MQLDVARIDPPLEVELPRHPVIARERDHRSPWTVLRTGACAATAGGRDDDCGGAEARGDIDGGVDDGCRWRVWSLFAIVRAALRRSPSSLLRSSTSAAARTNDSATKSASSSAASVRSAMSLSVIAGRLGRAYVTLTPFRGPICPGVRTRAWASPVS